MESLELDEVFICLRVPLKSKKDHLQLSIISKQGYCILLCGNCVMLTKLGVNVLMIMLWDNVLTNIISLGRDF